jgi:hypothetical protein
VAAAGFAVKQLDGFVKMLYAFAQHFNHAFGF